MTARREFTLNAVLAVCLCATGGSALAADYYVDKASGSRGNPGTQTQPWDDIDMCAARMVAGDTCHIKASGTYDKGNCPSPTPQAKHCGATPSCYFPCASGTQANPITFTAWDTSGDGTIQDHEKPVLSGNVSGAGVFTNDKDWIVFSHLKIAGGLKHRGSDVLVEHCEVWGGGTANDGNWSGLRCADCTRPIWRNNWVHDIVSSTGNGKCLTYYRTTDGLIEHNRIGPGCADEGMFHKKANKNTTIRRNIWEDLLLSRGDVIYIYENIFVNAGIKLENNLPDSPLNDYSIYNNTFYRGSITVTGRTGPIPGGRIWNNIFETSAARAFDSRREDDREPDYMDFNLYSPGSTFMENRYVGDRGEYGSLAAWRGASHPMSYDTNSIEADPLFVDPASRDFRLQASSPARGAGANGEDLGAYPRADGTVIGPTGELPFAGMALGPPGRPVLVER